MSVLAKSDNIARVNMSSVSRIEDRLVQKRKG